MRWAGPLPCGAAGCLARRVPDTASCATRPHGNTLGFILGGSTLVGAFICLASQKIRARFFLIGLAAAVAMIVLYDLPFDDLLLPPNGDV